MDLDKCAIFTAIATQSCALKCISNHLMTTFALISGHSLLHRHRSRIKRSFDVEMEGLDLRVPDSECSESGRLFYTSFETGLQIEQKRLDFSLGFLITTMFSLKSDLLKAYPNMTYVPLCLEINVLFIEAPTQHDAT